MSLEFKYYDEEETLSIFTTDELNDMIDSVLEVSSNSWNIEFPFRHSILEKCYNLNKINDKYSIDYHIDVCKRIATSLTIDKDLATTIEYKCNDNLYTYLEGYYKINIFTFDEYYIALNSHSNVASDLFLFDRYLITPITFKKIEMDMSL